MLKRVCAVTLLVASSLACVAAEQSVWRIGKFDESSREFKSQNIDYADPKSDPVYRVGTSQDESDWYRFQPGPANGMTGGRKHPFTILFTLKERPTGAYKLRIAMLYETPRLSYLRVDVNGNAGLFFFDPKLNYAAGDWEGTFVPQTSTDAKTITLPARFLKEGENKIVLTALDDGEVENSLGAIAPGHTGVVYDAFELLHDAAASNKDSAATARITPTIFFREKNGVLCETVQVIASYAMMPKSGTIELTVAGKNYQQHFQSDEQFGERRFEFDVPEWSGNAKSSVRLQTASGAETIRTELTPARKWTLFILPQEHLDVGFTDYAARVAELHSESIDGAMELINKHPEFRWTLDGFWVAQQYMAGRSEGKQKQFLDQVRAGTIAIAPEFANQHTANASWEGLARAFYGSHSFAKKYGLPANESAQLVDVPSYTWPFASILNDAGVKYFIGASNSWRAPIMLQGRWNEHSPFYWEGQDGKRVLMWYSRAYLQLHTLFGSPWRMGAVRDALPVFLQAYTRPDYKSHSAIIFGTQLENTALAREQAEIVSEWHKQYSYPRLQFASPSEAMRTIEQEAKGEFPVFRGDFGPYWEDGYGSDAASTATHRHNQNRILLAEKFSTAASLLNPNVRPDQHLLGNAWNNELVYDEHTWTYVGATTQPENQQAVDQMNLKRSRVDEADRQISETLQRTWGQFASLLSPKENSLGVFNALSWERSGLVVIDLPDGMDIVDPAGKVLPYEVQWVGKGIPLPGFGPGYRRVRFEASAVPALGYKLYAMKPATGDAAKSSEISGDTVENEFYRVQIDSASGALRSVFDKQLGKELVDQSSPYRFGAYLYVSGGDDYPNNSLYRYGAGLMPPKLTVHAATNGKLVGIRKVAYGTIIQLESSSTNTPKITSEIVLYDNEKKIEFRYHVKKERVLNRESVYFAFPFRAAAPRFSYATQNGWVDPAKDSLPGGSREWYVAMQWAGVESADFAAAVSPLDAPLVNFGDIMRGNWPREFKPASGTIFSWVMNNYWGTNFQAWQGGEFDFRYVVTSGAKLEPAALARLGWNSMTPMESAAVGPLSVPVLLKQNAASLLNIDNPDVLLTTWKLAEDGDGSVLRLHESAGKAQQVHLSSPYLRIEKAWLANLLEDKKSEITAEDGKIVVQLKPFEVVTVRLSTVPSSPPQAGE